MSREREEGETGPEETCGGREREEESVGPWRVTSRDRERRWTVENFASKERGRRRRRRRPGREEEDEEDDEERRRRDEV